MRRPNNTILSIMLLHLKIVPVKIHRSMRQHGGGSRTTYGVFANRVNHRPRCS
ncbi:tRNA (Thr-GGU) A37 N-methylase [Bradyrhizobium elkanii]|nr:tRNA (Thr-GGU) A37 N-methylase [Bradyrhizobium elkanii]MCS3967691.1 tRNA (Thr-GGU) A37 N-methylase [Bradyrhizobium japonicum]